MREIKRQTNKKSEIINIKNNKDEDDQIILYHIGD